MISRRNRRKLRKAEKRSNIEISNLDLSLQSVQLINLARSMTRAQFYYPNSVEVYTDGANKFSQLERDLENAQNFIHIQYYIFSDDDLGQRVASILERKAKQGVRVKLIYDHVGSFGTSNKFFKRLRAAGIEAHPFFKVTFPQLGTRINWRNHRKLVVIDGRLAYLGGMNVAQRYIDGGKSFNKWRDTHVRLTGAIVKAVNYSFAVDWNFMGGPLIDDAFAEPDNYATPGANAISNVGAQLLVSGPTSQWSNIAFSFQKAISMARKRVFIQTPYFLPTEALLKALQTAALAHIDVRIMLPAKSDSTMLTYASASYIAECLRSGIKFYLYREGMLHSKTIIIDDEIVSIGSTNFDFRSFDYNFESNIFFYSRDFNAKMLEIFRHDISNCNRVLADNWRKRPLGNKIAESILRLLSPVL